MRSTSGHVRLNGVDLRAVKLEQLYQAVTLVSAHSHIFKGTLRENLLMAKPTANDQVLKKALKLAHLDEFVKGLPDGLDTVVAEDGNSLSGGQKQRLALARTILADKPLIVFDEATSNIDVESESLIWETIYELAKEKTILVISHRLKTVRAAKMIHVLESGSLVESGTHDELMAKDGIYKKMTKVQLDLEQIREVI